MFIDFLTLMLINMVAGLVIFALYLLRWAEKSPQKAIPGFLLTGAIALVTGFHMIFQWPLPGPFNILFGEPTILLGGFLFMAGLSLIFSWDLVALGIYAALAGVVALIFAVRIMNLNLTAEPLAAAGGYAITGLTALLAWPAFAFPQRKWIRNLAATAALLSALAWLVVVLPAYWAHMDMFSKWAPK